MDEENDEREQDELGAFFLEVEAAIMGVLAARLGKLTADSTYVSVMSKIPEDMAKIYGIVERAAMKAKAKVPDIWQRLTEAADEWAKRFYAAKGKGAKSVTDIIGGTSIIDNGEREAANQVERFVRTSVMRMLDADGKPAGLREAYVSQCNYALAQIKAGQDPNKVVGETVKRLSHAGVRVEYKSGATRELYSAASMNIMDAYRQTQQDAENLHADEFGADGVEVSAHSMCAPDHLPYQGKQFTQAEFDAIQATLDRPIGKGYNCRHRVRRIVLGTGGISSKQRARAKRNSLREVKDPKGGTMTAYEFTQWQRATETRCRKWALQERLQREAGNVELADEIHRLNLMERRNYDRWSKLNGIGTRHERMML